MTKLMKMTAFTMMIMALVIMFGGIFFALSYMKVPMNTTVTSELAQGRIFFLNRVFQIASFVLLFGNVALSYAILGCLENKE